LSNYFRERKKNLIQIKCVCVDSFPRYGKGNHLKKASQSRAYDDWYEQKHWICKNGVCLLVGLTEKKRLFMQSRFPKAKPYTINRNVVRRVFKKPRNIQTLLKNGICGRCHCIHSRKLRRFIPLSLYAAKASDVPNAQVPFHWSYTVLA